MRIEPISVEMAEKNKSEIAKLYFENVHSVVYCSHYTYDEAYEKMDSLISHLADNTAVVYGAYEDETLIGFIWAYPHQFREEMRMYVSEIRVAEEFRNRGIGRQLLRCVENRAKEMQISAMYLHMEAGNTDVKKFYETNGFMEERIQMRKAIPGTCTYGTPKE